MTYKKKPVEVPDHVIESFARCLLPTIREYFKSKEGQRDYTKWKTENLKYDMNEENDG